MKPSHLLLLYCVLDCFLLPVATWADGAAAPPRVIEGVATTPEGTPSAGTTLYLLDLPGSYTYPTLDDRGTVATDADGRFTWAVPPDLADNVFTDRRGRHTPPACHALPIGGDWSVRFGLAHDYDANSARQDLLRQAAQPCRVRWLERGANPFLSVTVPDTGTVSVLVRGPDGQPVAVHAVDIVTPSSEQGDYGGGVIYGGTTDAAGRLHLRLFPGLRQLLLSVPGIGFGATGTIEVMPNAEVAAQMPPLAPFATISGTVAPGLRKPGGRVRFDDNWAYLHAWYDPQAEIDGAGRFTLTGVLPGEHRIALVDSPQPAQEFWLTVHPGEQITGVVIEPQTAADQEATRPINFSQARKPAIFGHVTDPAGHPVPGIDVSVFCYTSWGFPQYRDALTAKTDAQGAYRVPDVTINAGQMTVSVIAVDPGRPIAQRFVQPQAWWLAPSDLQADLVVPSGHPGLTIRVLQDGRAVAGATVRLTPPERPNPFGQTFSNGLPDSAREKFEALVHPTATTDAHGEAHFVDITPGLWDVTAIAGDDKHAFNTVGQGSSGAPQTAAFNISRGVIVQDGPPRRFTMMIYSQPNTIAFRPVGPAGQTPPRPTVGFEFGNASLKTLLAIPVDDRGISTYNFAQPGVWQTALRFRETAQDGFPATDEPLYEGRSLVAVSPALAQAAPREMLAARRAPGSIRVRLVDDLGRPSSGTASIGEASDQVKNGASLDVMGEAVFTDMPAGTYVVEADAAVPLTAPRFGSDDDPFPTDAALTGTQFIFPQLVTVRAGQETAITFRSQPAGYVRGRAIPASAVAIGRAISDQYEPAMAVRYDPKTGEYLAGPFPPGPATLQVSSTRSQTVWWPGAGERFPVMVQAGRVVHQDLTLDPAVIVPPVRPHTARVLMPDGKTPAWGARATIFPPHETGGSFTAQADAAGRLCRLASANPYGLPEHAPLDDSTGPVIVALLPGANGATIVPDQPGKDLRIVLPAAISLRGRVTVGRTSIRGLNGSFRVRADYQGPGQVNDLLSVEATAQADGTFELAGLTPGTYRVQAARDNVWLSQTTTLTAAGTPLPDLTLEIAPPGSPIILHVVDKTGQPLPDRTITLMRPAGPLTEALWPKTLMTDGRGNAALPGLEAGRHQIRLPDCPLYPNPVAFVVPALPSGEATGDRIIVIAPDTGHFSRAARRSRAKHQ